MPFWLLRKKEKKKSRIAPFVHQKLVRKKKNTMLAPFSFQTVVSEIKQFYCITGSHVLCLMHMAALDSLQDMANKFASRLISVFVERTNKGLQ